MNTEKAILFLRSITPMHVGSGSALGIVDLPIQRERHTDYPKIEGSSLKGAIREAFEGFLEIDKNKNKFTIKNLDVLKDKFEDIDEIVKKKDKEQNKEIEDTIKINNQEMKKNKYYEAIQLVFGPENETNSYAGAVSFTDARILLFPVKSVKGVFAWITCPGVLKRFEEDLKIVNPDLNFSLSISDKDIGDDEIMVKGDILKINNKVVLEEYTFTINDHKRDGAFEFLNHLPSKLKINKEKVAIVSDNTFRDFVEMSTEVITRVKIGASGTVEHGALWTEEYLPAETIMYSLVIVNDIFNENKGIFEGKDNIAQSVMDDFIKVVIGCGLKNKFFIGGNTTIGKGLTQIQIQKPNNNGNNNK